MSVTPIHLSKLKHRELFSEITGEKYSLSALLHELVGFKDLFIHHEIVPPGRRSSAPHSHTYREEMIFVLEGTPTARLKDQVHPLKPGDLMGFLPGNENFHVIENNSETPAHLLVIASNPKFDDVIYGSDSKNHRNDQNKSPVLQ